MLTNTSHPKEYRRDPSIRRCCWYCIVGSFVCLGATIWVGHRAGQDNWFVYILPVAFFSIPAVIASILLCWRLRIDEHGITRQTLFRQDFWSWDDIASGKISKSRSELLYDSSRPFWHRSLNSHLSIEDYNEVLAAINEHYLLPPAPEIPETLTVKYGFRNKATFDQSGVHLVSRKQIHHHYKWNDILDVHITRRDPKSRNFRTIVITLPDQEDKMNEILLHSVIIPEREELTNFFMKKFLPKRYIFQ